MTRSVRMAFAGPFDIINAGAPFAIIEACGKSFY